MRYRHALKRAWYFGLRYRCVVCGARTRIRKTISLDVPSMREKDVVGAEYAPGDDCPVCYANRRSRLIYAFLTRRRPLRRGEKVLHLAPELALYRHVFRGSGADYHPAALYPQDYPEIPGMARVDVAAIPWPDRTFDLVLCNHVLEHVPDDRGAMGELRRVLKPDGIALLQVPLSLAMADTDEDLSPMSDQARERRFGQCDHLRLYAVADYLRRLEAAGFEVRLAPPEEIAGAAGVEALQLNPRERLVIARPRAEAPALRTEAPAVLAD